MNEKEANAKLTAVLSRELVLRQENIRLKNQLYELQKATGDIYEYCYICDAIMKRNLGKCGNNCGKYVCRGCSESCEICRSRLICKVCLNDGIDCPECGLICCDYCDVGDICIDCNENNALETYSKIEE